MLLAFGGPGRQDSHRVITIEAAHPGEVRAEQRPDLLGDRCEQLSAFAIAIATSSVNDASRASAPVGSGFSADREPTTMRPHRLPSTMTGVPAAERTPRAAGEGTERARGIGIAIYPRRARSLEHERDDVVPAQALPLADRKPGRTVP